MMREAAEDTPTTAVELGVEPPATRGDRDPRGRYLPGHRIAGPGRPRLDVRAIAESKAAESGVSLEHEVWLVLVAMLERAKKGDAVAAKLVLDRLAGTDPLAVNVS